VAFPRDETAYLQLALKLDSSNEQRAAPATTSGDEEQLRAGPMVNNAAREHEAMSKGERPVSREDQEEWARSSEDEKVPLGPFKR